MIRTLTLLSEDDCKGLVTELEKFKFTDGKASATGYAREIKENFQLESTRPETTYIFDQVKKLINAHPLIKKYVMPVKYPRMFANFYSGGNHYHWHADNAIMYGERTDYSFTISVKDPSTYEGGALEMKLDNGDIKSFRLPMGDMVFYPTGQLHRVTEVTSGSRLSIVGWMQSAFKDAEDRALHAEYQDLMDWAYAECKLGWEDMNRFNQFKQKFIRRLVKESTG